MQDEEVIRAAFGAWNEGGFDAFLDYLAPDVEWHAPPGYPEGEVWQGREAIAKDWKEQFDSVFSETSVVIEELIEAPRGWYSTTRAVAKAGASGMDLEWRNFFVSRVEEGKLKQVWVFFDAAQARREAGLDT